MNEINKTNLFGFDFVNVSDYKPVLDEFEQGIKLHKSEIPLMITPNVDQLVKYNRKSNKKIYSILKQSKYIFPDGQPIVSFSKILGKGLKARLTGSDFFPLIWDLLKKKNVNVGFILPNSELGKKFRNEADNVFFYAPPFFDLKNKNEFDKVIEECYEMVINNNVEYLFLGLGYPKQEYISVVLLEKLNKKMPFTFLLGASYEFYHGMKKRAPKIYQKLGVEFAYRLFTEPKRMAKRYLIDDLYFIVLIIKEFLNNHKFVNKRKK
jgi:N-acetylglucosaminyldiphosphoundecaprenol N-acetyl-beta-D-mannosaminyltransferase